MKYSFMSLDQQLGGHAPFLVSLSDGPDNELRIVIAPAVVGVAGAGPGDTGSGILNDILSKCRPIEPDKATLYEIYFENYIIYQVKNESYAAYDPDEILSGQYLAVVEKSKFLDSIDETTNAFQLDNGTFFPGEWKQYSIYTQNHVIEIISHCPPKVTKIP